MTRVAEGSGGGGGGGGAATEAPRSKHEGAAVDFSPPGEAALGLLSQSTGTSILGPPAASFSEAQP